MALATDSERAREQRQRGNADADTRRIAAWIEPQEVILDADLRDRRHAIELASAAFGRAHRRDPAPVLRALWRRELVGSTAIGHGLAIPHARIDGIDRPLTLFMRPKWPIDFAAPDGKPVASILVILVPSQGDTDDHLQLLALVAQMFSDHRFLARLSDATEAADVRSAFADCVQMLA